ncbi:glycogen debranching enzyme family protein [Fulvivirga sp. 29W222]|uniref:Glycogen debranching enzyme family protein n=1 Tax=Fulvivirga marina TaxID=2494733 RepID=A0A937G2I4_9BACT|nr:amylo-alpha-1,6-glucosidase [Fulvivirga marina]MBL6448853.1 glycogen debranching enzyme family protein [Fulvivirga marina]
MSYIKLTKPLLNDISYSKEKEILLTNCLGAYCSTSVSTCNTRKYHGLLVIPQPKIDDQHHVMISNIDETVKIGKTGYALAVHQYPGVHFPEGQQYMKSFLLEKAPKWTFYIGEVILEKEIILSRESNTLMIRYHILEGKGKIKLQLRPFIACRNYHTLRNADNHSQATFKEANNGVRFSMFRMYDPLFFQSTRKGTFSPSPDWYHNIEYYKEKERGYDYTESLFVPGNFEYTLHNGDELIFAAGTREVKPRLLKRTFQSERERIILRKDFGSCLQNAAEQFIVHDNQGAYIIAGWPWFGKCRSRDTFIALPGLTLTTGKPALFKLIMDSMLKKLKRGFFPNTGKGKHNGYNAVDAPLWCIWALQQYAIQTGDSKIVWQIYGHSIKSILKNFKNGTHYNTHMLKSGLISSEHTNHALTWMDAEQDGTPITPRFGMPVEVNSLWYNAVNFALHSAEQSGDKTFVNQWSKYPELIKGSFISAYWNEAKGYLADNIDGENVDWSFRPNQLFAISLPFSPLNSGMSESIIDQVKDELLTTRGVRTLSPSDPNYRGTYFGDQSNRDLSYHQGTAWIWLLGPFIEAYLNVKGTKGISFVKKIYNDLEPAIIELGLGTLCEVYNGSNAVPGGAISQAWSIAEVLRVKQLIAQYSTQKKNILKNKSSKIKELYNL